MAASPYTAEQEKFVRDLRLKRALSFTDIATRFSKRFGTPRTRSQMRHLFLAVEEVASHPLADFVHSAFGGRAGTNRAKRARFFVTAASPVSELSAKERIGNKARRLGTNLHVPFFGAIQGWLATQGAELVILPMRAHERPLKGQPAHYDPRLADHRDRFFSEFQFGPFVKGLDVHLNPQQVKPLTGLHRIRGSGVRKDLRFNQTLIVAHAKQDMDPIATGNGTEPRLLWSTGACTLPEYQRNRIGSIAAEEHKIGGLVVEVDGDRFFVRNVRADADGSFCDVDGWRYLPDGTREKVRAKSIRPGDVHSGLEDVEVLSTWARLAGIVAPEAAFIEDVFDGGSISHHLERQNVTRARRAVPFRSLDEELAYCRALLASLDKTLLPSGGDLVIVASNHHEHLGRWIEEGRYLKDDLNTVLGHQMFLEMVRGEDPLHPRLDPEERYEWLDTESDYFVEGVQMGGHGHLGTNGMRGSPVQLEKAYGACQTGHTHSGFVHGDHFGVGHSSKARHGYNRGPTTWGPTAALVWPGGQQQSVRAVDGYYCLDDLLTGATDG